MTTGENHIHFKDYYDFAAVAARDRDFREVVYSRKAELKMAEVALQSFEHIRHINRRYAQDEKIISKWWQNNESTLSFLPTETTEENMSGIPEPPSRLVNNYEWRRIT